MKLTLSHDFVEESLADKARWFASLTLEERMAWLDEWTEIVLQNNPDILEKFGDDNSYKGPLFACLEKHGVKYVVIPENARYPQRFRL
jgi:hypothetical protein